MKEFNVASFLPFTFRLIAFFTTFLLNVTPGLTKTIETFIINSSSKDKIALAYTNTLLSSQNIILPPGDTLRLLFDENSFSPTSVNFIVSENQGKPPTFLVLPGDVIHVNFDKAANTYEFTGNNPAELGFYKKLWQSRLALKGIYYEIPFAKMPASLDEFLSEWHKIRLESDALLKELRQSDGIRPEIEIYLTRELKLRVFSVLILPATYHDKKGPVRMLSPAYHDSVVVASQFLKDLQHLPTTSSENLLYALRGYILFKAISQGLLPTFKAQYELAKKEYTGLQREWVCYSILRHARSLHENVSLLLKDYRTWVKPGSKFLRKLNGEENPVELGRELTSSDMLSGLDKGNISLLDLLTKHQGKVIYLDFWASWCAPCIEEFPAADKIRKQYKEKELVMVYLSIDEDVEKWQRASVKYLKDKPEQYRFDNKELSSFIKHFNIKSIPRYIIINPSGKVRLADAPRPSDPFLKEVLSGLVKK